MRVAVKNLFRTFFPATALAAVLSFGALTVSPVEAGIIAKWHFNSLQADTDFAGPIAADQTAMGVSSGGLVKGDGIDPFQTRTVGGQNVMRFRNDEGANTRSLAIANKTYGEFTLTANAGYSLNLTGFDIKAMSANGAPNFQSRYFFVQYRTGNIGAFTDLIADTLVPGGSLTSHSASLSLTNLQSITFRIYGYNNPTGSTRPDRGLQYDDIVVKGAAVPEPGSMSLLAVGLAGFAALRRRRSGRGSNPETKAPENQ